MHEDLFIDDEPDKETHNKSNATDDRIGEDLFIDTERTNPVNMHIELKEHTIIFFSYSIIYFKHAVT